MYLNRKNLKVVFHVTPNAMLVEGKIQMDVFLRNACLTAAFPPLLLHKGHIYIKCMGSWSQIKWAKLNYSIPSFVRDFQYG